MASNLYLTISVKEYAALQRILGVTRGTLADGDALFASNQARALIVALIREYERHYGAVPRG